MANIKNPVILPDFWVLMIREHLEKQAQEYKNRGEQIPGPLYNSIAVIDERRKAAGFAPLH